MLEVQVQNDEAEAHEQLDYAVKEHPGTAVLRPKPQPSEIKSWRL